MKSAPLIMILCFGLSSFPQTWGLEFHMNSTDDNLHDQLTCSMKTNPSNEQILSIIDITIIDFTHSRNKLKLASASILEKDLYVQHTRNIKMRVSGSVSKDHAELVIWFNKESQWGLGSFLCELTYMNFKGHTNKNHAAVKARLPYDLSQSFSYDSEVTLTEQINRTTGLLEGAMKYMNNTVDQLNVAKVSMKNAMDETMGRLSDRVTGLQLALTNNSNGRFATLQTALTNQNTARFTDLETELTNLIRRHFTVLRTSLTNKMNDRFTSLETALAIKDSAGEQYFDVMGTGKNEWRLAFRGTARINKSVFDAYKGVGVNVEPGCKQIPPTGPCNNHYRNDDVLDKWQDIDEVAFVLYKGSSKVKQIVFDAAGTTNMNWFHNDNIKSSSWDDLKPATTFNFFSIEGYKTRKFYINYSHGGCVLDVGWFAASDVTIACPWDSDSSFPTFLYSEANTRQTWQSGQVGKADVLAVFVKYY